MQQTEQKPIYEKIKARYEEIVILIEDIEKSNKEDENGRTE